MQALPHQHMAERWGQLILRLQFVQCAVSNPCSDCERLYDSEGVTVHDSSRGASTKCLDNGVYCAEENTGIVPKKQGAR